MIDYSKYDAPIARLVNIGGESNAPLVLNENPIQLRAVGRAMAQAQLWKLQKARVEIHVDEMIVTTEDERRHITWQRYMVHEAITLWPDVQLPSPMIAYKSGHVYTIVVHDEDGERLSHRHTERQLWRVWNDQHSAGIDEDSPLFVHPAFEVPKDYIAGLMLSALQRNQPAPVLIHGNPDAVTDILAEFYRAELRLQFEGTPYETEAQRTKRQRRFGGV